MKDPITGVWLENHSCPRCRFRHPNVWSCARAAAVAEAQRSEPEPADVFDAFDAKNEAIAHADALLSKVGLATYSQVVATIEGMVVETAA